VADQFEQLLRLITAFDVTEGKKAENVGAVRIALMERMEAIEDYTHALTAKSAVGAFLQLCIVGGLMGEIEGAIDYLADDKDALHDNCRREANDNIRKIRCLLHSLRKWVRLGLGERLSDCEAVASWFVGTSDIPHDLIAAILASAGGEGAA
jgi:hypothetical protein